MITRLLLGAAGLALGVFGVFRLVTQTPHHALLVLIVWLAAAVVLHDGILSPSLFGVGALLRRVIPSRALPFVQGGLMAAALVTVIAIPLIHRQQIGPEAKALLRQDYRVNLGILFAVVLVVAVLLYVRRVVLSRPSTTKHRPPEDQDSATP